MVFNPESADFISLDSEDGKANELMDYLQHQPPEVLSRVAQSVSGEIKQIILTNNVQGLVGVLPADGFNVQVHTDRGELSRSFSLSDDDRLLPASDGAANGARD